MKRGLQVVNWLIGERMFAIVTFFLVVTPTSLGGGISLTNGEPIPLLSGDWLIEVVEDMLPSSGFVGLRIGPDDYPHIEYSIDGTTYLKYGKRNETQWERAYVDQTGHSQTTVGLDVGPDGTPHICYSLKEYDGTTLRHAFPTESGWISERVDELREVTQVCSIFVDSSNEYHISYQTYWTGQLRYAHFNGTNWSTEVVDESFNVGGWSSIAVSPSGAPSIAYEDYQNRTIRYATKVNDVWNISVANPDQKLGGSIWPSLDFGPGGEAHIVYVGGAVLKMTSRIGSNWVDKELLPYDAPQFPSFKISSSGEPHIAYWAGSKLNYTTRPAGEWLTETLIGFELFGLGTSIDLDSNDLPHCAFIDHRNGIVYYATKANFSVNLPPIADAGPDQTVNEGDTVQFDGTGSTGGGNGTGEWVWKASVPSFRMSGGSATLDDNLYFIGGEESDDGIGPYGVSDLVEVYDAGNDTWFGHFYLPEPRAGLGAAAVGGKVFAIGGNNGTDSTDSTFEYDPATGGWTEKASMPMALEGFGIATVNDKIYIMGGYSTLIDCYPCAGTFEYDPSSDSWTQKADLPTGRNALAAVALNGKIYAIGGDANGIMDDVEVYDPATDTWTTAEDMIEPRSHLRAEALGGYIFVMGGYGGLVAPRTVDVYDVVQNNWTVLEAEIAEPRIGPGSGVVGSCVYLLGGHSSHMAGIHSLNEQYCLDSELQYEWDFDSTVDLDSDGDFINDKEATGPTPTHTYHDDGIFVVTLTAVNSQGLRDTDQCNITVQNVAPVPEWTSRSADGTILTPPYPEGKEILFEATVSDPGIYDTFTYDWDFGDGTILLDAGPSVIHAYGDDKTYTVALTVTDDDGGVGVDDTPPMPTTNEDPVPQIDLPFCIFVEGLDPCEAIGSFSDPGWLDTHAAVWDFGDGTSEMAVLTEKHDPPASTGWNISSHLYGDNGLYTITFTVTDDDGGEGTATAEVPVQNHPPSFDLYVPITVNEGEQFVLGVEATDPGSDDLAIRVDWGDGTIDSRIYYNDGVGPDPPNSGAGAFPFVVQANFTHVYPDDGNWDVTVEVEDDDGGIDVKAFQIPVLNVAPTVTLEVLPIEVNASLRIAGEKWHDVTIEMYEDGELIAGGTLVRYPGSPDEQRLDLTQLQVDFSKKYSAIVRYTPEDDPINGQPNGANPCWIILTFSDGQELWIHHTFNVQHPDTHVWEVDLTAAILMHGLTFQATASDPGADDLTFYWDFGDGTNATSFHPNANGTFPVDITQMINHVFPGSGTYIVVLTVEDDDGGVGTASLTIVIP